MPDENEITLPPIGLYHDIPFDTYKAWPALNASTLVHGRTNMEHLKEAIDGHMGMDSKDLAFGRAFHCRLLEPHLYHERYLISTPCMEPLKTGKRKGEPCGNTASYLWDGSSWLCGIHAPEDAIQPEEYVTPEDAETLELMAAKIKSHNIIKLIRQHGGFETSMIWNYEGIPLKGRVDKHIPAGTCPATILDLKKVRSKKGDDDSFARSVKEYHYDIRAAMYVDAIKALTDENPIFVWGIIEDKRPFSINTIYTNRETLAVGRYKYKKLIDDYRHCESVGEWPGYSDDLHPGGLSEYEIKVHSSAIQEHMQ